MTLSTPQGSDTAAWRTRIEDELGLAYGTRRCIHRVLLILRGHAEHHWVDDVATALLEGAEQAEQLHKALKEDYRPCEESRKPQLRELRKR